MKRNWKRLASLVMVLAMALCALPAMAEGEHGPLWIEGGEGKTLTWWVPIDSTSAQYMETYAEHPFFQWMEEQTGVHVEFIHPSHEQMEQQFNLMMTSGSYYDILFTPSYPDGPQAAITDGVFVDLKEFEALMPNYFEMARCGDSSVTAWEWGPEKDMYYCGPQPAFIDLTTTVQGNVWCVSQLWTDRLPTECGAVIRQDWLDEAGLSVPTTVEELEVVLEAFSKRGENIIPMALGTSGVNDSSGYLVSAFDTFPNWFNVKDGVVCSPSFTTAGGKEYVELIRDWYGKGYIDRDFMNRDGEAVEALFLSGRLGLIGVTWADPSYFEENYMGEGTCDVTALPPVKKTPDQQLHYVQNYDSQACNYSVIAANSENKELAAQWLDKLFSKEAILRGQYGVEGESYTLVDGVPYFTEWYYENIEANNLRETYMMPNITCYWSARANALYQAVDTSIEGQQTVCSEWYKASEIWSKDSSPDLNIGYVTFDGTGWGDMYDPYVEAETYALPMFMRMMVGTEDIAKWDEVVAKAMDMGWKTAREQMQAAYNAQHQQPADFGMDQ